MKKFIRIMPLFVALAMVLLLVPAAARADADAVANKPAARWVGEGSADFPYEIYNEEDLIALAYSVNTGTTFEGAYFEIQNDIELTEEWTPIGIDKDHRFMGTLDTADGEVMKITGLVINDYEQKYAGLFGVTKQATIKNLEIESPRSRPPTSTWALWQAS